MYLSISAATAIWAMWFLGVLPDLSIANNLCCNESLILLTGLWSISTFIHSSCAGEPVGSVVRMPLGINLNGSRFDPRTLKIDNYLLLYFWAGYANDNTNLKALYNKYQSHGLSILAISMEPFRKMWRDSVKKERIGMWYNIFSDPVANLDTFYNIREMAPSLVLLIDKNKTIIGRYRGRNKFYKMDYDEEPLAALEKKLAEIIKK